ncbi:MAG: hypothetical protein B7C24_17935 [Bacteroidetes bacterium 4572_77]|nr:MAG: hypothetical protein B7C24_17935 [Bacteroidetes bacterium 4572_77]
MIVWDVLKEKEKLMGDLSFKVEGSSSQCGQLIVNYAEQVYHTVRIGNQCWMQENLNIGTRININQKMQDNSFFEKYCYDNNEINCDIYGGLYQWDEMMQYSTQESAQGICPNGWHIPSDNEWKEMEIFLGMKQRKANNTGWRGADEGETLKSTSGRNNNGYGTNSSGFNALLGGCRNITGSFSHLGRLGYWWSSTENSGSHAWYRSLGIDYSQVHRYDHYKSNGRSIRCLKN